MALQDGYILIPRTHSKRDYAFRIKDPEMGTLSKIIQVDPQYIHQCPHKRCNVMMEKDWGDTVHF